MIQKTIRGKKCPNCASFMEETALACGVCGYKPDGGEPTIPSPRPEQREFPGPTDPLLPGKKEIICGKCGTVNQGDSRFCKICRHPLTESQNNNVKTTPQDTRDDVDTKRSGAPANRLTIDWIKAPPGDKTSEELQLLDLSPYFTGYVKWRDYTFLVYRNRMANQYEILTRKIEISDESTLFKKCQQVFIARSGSEFYLGSLRFQLVGNLSQGEELKTIIKPEQTLFVGPGEPVNRKTDTGLPGLKALNLFSQKNIIEITQKILIGREFLAKQWEVAEDTLRKNGISKEHIYLTPLPDGLWLIEPLPDKPLYVEIAEVPQSFTEKDILRWTFKDRFGEFKINIKINH
jgi:ribosomal protein S27AE